ncbi:MAG: aldo/keto reductase [Bacillota bacterium]
MQYREFGKTGYKISALGFGAMRLPSHDVDGKWVINRDEAIAMIHKASELGVNYIDTAYGYHDGESEIVVGLALKSMRDKWVLSTKCPIWSVKEKGAGRMYLEEQLGKLGTDHIDIYHLHGIGNDETHELLESIDFYKDMEKAKEEGLIKNLSFSSHGSPEFVMKMVDQGIFSSILCQYNLLDRNYEKAFEYAHANGVGTVAMGPVAGGRLAFPTDVFENTLNTKFEGTYEAALRFVLANTNITCALSGMSTMEQVEANVKVASIAEPLSTVELEKVKVMLAESKDMADLYCTGCNYCSGCPSGIKIAEVFKLMNYHQVFHLTEMAKREYSNIGKNEWSGKPATDCTECGKCEKICPQNLKIIQKLKDVNRELGA